MPMLPASSDDLRAELWQRLTPKQTAFVQAYHISGNASQAYRQAYDAANMASTSITIEAFNLLRHPNIAPIIASGKEAAQAMAESYAPQAIEKLRMLSDASEEDTAARLAVAERASARILEAAKVIGSGASIQVNVDNRRIDGEAMRLWQEGGSANYLSRTEGDGVSGSADST